MPRTRQLKHEFFMNAGLAEVPPLGRLLLAALWTLADADGIVEDEGERLKALTLPYDDDCDVEDLLDALEGRGFILRYGSNGGRYIYITQFRADQKPHPNEHAAGLPAPDKGQLRKAQQQLLELRDQREHMPDFIRFWEAYPRRQAKQNAARAWSQLTKHERFLATGVAEVMKKLVEAGHQNERFVPLPATFLNGRRWEDWSEGVPAGWMDPDVEHREAMRRRLVAAANEVYGE